MAGGSVRPAGQSAFTAGEGADLRGWAVGDLYQLAEAVLIMLTLIFWRVVSAALFSLFRGKLAMILLCAAYLVGCAMGFLNGIGLLSLEFISRR